METNTVKLQEPLETPEGTIDEMIVVRPKGKDLWQLDKINIVKPSYKDFVQIVSVCQKLPLSTIKEMDGGDLMAVAGVLLTFLNSTLPTGGTSGEI